MAQSSRTKILLAVAAVAVAGIAYVTVSGRSGPEEGVEGTMGAAERQHLAEKTQYHEELQRVDSLSIEKIERLGKVAAQFDKDPAEANKMLKEFGWTKAEFDKMVKAVRENDEMDRVFRASKNLASQQ